MSETALVIRDGNGQKQKLAEVLDGSGNLQPIHNLALNGILVGPTNPLPVTQAASEALTPADASAFEVMTGNTPVVAFAANSIKTGAYITNPVTATQPLFVDMVNTPTAASPGANGTTDAVYPGQDWTAPGPLTTPVQVVSTDSAHFFVAIRY